MKVKEAREILSGMELSDGAMAKAEGILSKYTAVEEIPDEVIDEILKIVDLEIDETKLAADIYESGAELADEYLGKIDDQGGKVSQDRDDATQKQP